MKLQRKKTLQIWSSWIVLPLVCIHLIFYHQSFVAFLSSSQSCLLCSLCVTFCELPSHQFLCQTHFPFMRVFGKRGFQGLFVLVSWTSSVFRAFSSETESIHLEGWQAHLKECWTVRALVQKRLPIRARAWCVTISLRIFWGSKILLNVMWLLWHFS